MPALCPGCERVVWGDRPSCDACELLLLPRDAEQLIVDLDEVDHPDQLIDRSLLIYETGNNEGAIAELLGVLERWPASGRAYLALGLARTAQGSLLPGMRCISRAVRLDPARLAPPRSPPEVLAVHSARERRDQLEATGCNPQVGLELGQFRAMSGDYSGALDAYTDALTEYPEDAELLTAIGVALRVLGNASEAIEMHQRALAARPDFALAYNNLASAYADLANLEGARNAAHRAVELQPDLGHAQVSLAFALLDAGETDEAIAALHDAERRTRGLRPHVAALLAFAALEQGQAEESIAEASDGLAHRFSHRVPQLYLVLAEALDALDDIRGAREAREPLWTMATQPVPETPELPDRH